jgi:oxygen-independent coproporphyrinogen-3 oxidase
MLGLYLHIPFCRSRCSYCDFYFVVDTKSGTRERFVAALRREILTARRESPLPADTVYLGGGTPSLLEPEETEKLLGACREAFALERNAEITLEANPEDLSPARAQGFREAGVTRLSLGAQSFREDALRLMMRPHDAGQIEESFRAARRAGFESINIDLICGLPGETAPSWRRELRQALSLKPDHFSLYVLELHERTYLARQVACGAVLPSEDEATAGMFEAAVAALEAENFEHYEISNFALPGHASRHNLKYWSDGPYLGFGPSAHSYAEGKRWANAAHLRKYLDAVEHGRSPALPPEPMSRERLAAERVILGMRKRSGHALSPDDSAYLEGRAHEMERFLTMGLVERKNGLVRLTRKGLLVSNEVFAALLDEEATEPSCQRTANGFSPVP